jgi:hypothetical protein
MARGEYWRNGVLTAVIDLDNTPYRFTHGMEDVQLGGYLPEYQSPRHPIRKRDLREALFEGRRPELYGALTPARK